MTCYTFPSANAKNGKLLGFSNVCLSNLKVSGKNNEEAALNGGGEENRESQICARTEQYLPPQKKCYVQSFMYCPNIHKYFIQFRRKPALYVTYMAGHSS